MWPDINDVEGVERDAVHARRLGMSGKSTFHPSQIDIINRVFTPTEEELDYARRVVQAFNEAMARGDGAVAFGGQLLDLPIVERAKRSLRISESLLVQACVRHGPACQADLHSRVSSAWPSWWWQPA